MPLPPEAAQRRDWLRRLRSIAEAGLMYGQDRYDLKRYRELQEMTGAMSAAVFQEGRILMVRERSDGLWTLPGGWADPGQSPSAVTKNSCSA